MRELIVWKIDVKDLRRPKANDIKLLNLFRNDVELLMKSKEGVKYEKLILTDDGWYCNYNSNDCQIYEVYTNGGVSFSYDDDNKLVKLHPKYGILSGYENIRFIGDSGEIIYKDGTLKYLNEDVKDSTHETYLDRIERLYQEFTAILNREIAIES